MLSKAELKDHKLLVRQNISCWPELGINYWGINKNASSTLTIHFATLCGDIDPTEEEIDSGQLAKQGLGPRYINSKEAFRNGLKNFTVVRHPLDRFISIYKHLKYPRTEEQCRTQHKARFNPTWSPEEFLDCIRTSFETGKKINKHWRRQCSFIPHFWRMDHIIKLERLIEDWPFDFSPPDIKSNPTVDRLIKIKEHRVYDLYHEDYLFFGYPYQK